MITEAINIAIVNRGKIRFDGSFYLNEDSRYSRVLEKNEKNCDKLGSIATVYNPGIFKRQFCVQTERAVQYFQSSDVKSSITRSQIFVNKKQADDLGLLVHSGDILVTGFGTIGNIRIVAKNQDGVCYANNVCRVNAVKAPYLSGYIYAVLSSKYGYAQLNKNASGSVVRYIEAPGIKQTLIPRFSPDFQMLINSKISESQRLRSESIDLINQAESILKTQADLPTLSADDYDYFGPRSDKRKVSCFTRRIGDIGSTTINAFNNSERIRKIQQRILANSRPIKDLIEGGQTFSSGSLPNIEVKPGHGIMLINQKDIFDNIVVGKYISSKNANLDELVQYGEILIASDGTLGENELFCRAIFANEDLAGSFISCHFMRMRSNGTVPVGYLFSWLNSDYGFRLIRNTQAGTKICHPIQKMFQNIPVPIIDKDKMDEIDLMVRTAFTKRHQANNLEKEAIQMVENEIDKWNNN